MKVETLSFICTQLYHCVHFVSLHLRDWCRERDNYSKTSLCKNVTNVVIFLLFHHGLITNKVVIRIVIFAGWCLLKNLLFMALSDNNLGISLGAYCNLGFENYLLYSMKGSHATWGYEQLSEVDSSTFWHSQTQLKLPIRLRATGFSR